jgi:hypothetical protein
MSGIPLRYISWVLKVRQYAVRLDVYEHTHTHNLMQMILACRNPTIIRVRQ